MSLVTPVAVEALPKAACEFVTKTILKSWLQKFGGKDVAAGTSDWLKVEGVVVEYYSHPDDTRLEKALEKLLDAGADKFFPALGLTIKGGKFLFGSREELGKPALAVESIIQVAKNSQLHAFVCGAPGLRPQFASQGFFELDAMRNRGITCENFPQRVRNASELAAIKQLWFGYYSRLLKEGMGNPNKPDPYVDNLLTGGWETIELGWEENRGAEIVEGLRNEIRHSRESDPTDAAQCTAEATATPTPIPSPTPKPAPVLVTSAHGCRGFYGTWQAPLGWMTIYTNNKVSYFSRTQAGIVDGRVFKGSWTEPKSDGAFTYTLRPDADSFDASEHNLGAAKWSTFAAQCVKGLATPPPAPTPMNSGSGQCPGNMIYFPGLGCRPNPM